VITSDYTQNYINYFSSNT